MIPRRIKGFTNTLAAPQGWDTARDGICVALHVRAVKLRSDGPVICKSAWEPTPEELAELNRGGSVILTVYGGQPPVELQVEPSVEDPS